METAILVSGLIAIGAAATAIILQYIDCIMFVIKGEHEYED